jgi:hypothetical protein
MLRKIYYSGGRRIKGEEEKGEKTRRYRRRKAGDALSKERRRERWRKGSFKKSFSRVRWLFILIIDFSAYQIFFTSIYEL